jgi:hypothetical protein
MLPGDAIGPGFADPGTTVPAASGSTSGVSWGAVIAGGVTAAAISTILGIFGVGLGLASVSPFAGHGVNAATFTVMAAIWLIVVQWIASLFGGYMAGRLRTKWVAVHSDEVFFRDTAHGFLAWALGTLIVVGVLASVSGTAAQTGANAAATLAQNNTAGKYYAEMLFRAPATGNAAPTGSALGAAAPATNPQQAVSQAGTILAQDMAQGDVPSADQSYLAQLVAQTTGMSPADAQARVQQVVSAEKAAAAKARQVADASRKAASGAAIYTFVSLLIGAFIASVAGAIGGKLRDNY